MVTGLALAVAASCIIDAAAWEPEDPQHHVPSTPRELLPANGAPTSQKQGRVVGYYSNWAQHRGGGYAFVPESINPALFTNIAFAFAFITPSFGIATTEVGARQSPCSRGPLHVHGQAPCHWHN
jgi:GH18 family chitinase